MKSQKGSPVTGLCTQAQTCFQFIYGTAIESWKATGPDSQGGPVGREGSPHCLELNEVVDVNSPGCSHFTPITDKHIQKNKSRAIVGPANHHVFLLASVHYGSIDKTEEGEGGGTEV